MFSWDQCGEPSRVTQSHTWQIDCGCFLQSPPPPALPPPKQKKIKHGAGVCFPQSYPPPQMCFMKHGVWVKVSSTIQAPLINETMHGNNRGFVKATPPTPPPPQKKREIKHGVWKGLGTTHPSRGNNGGFVNLGGLKPSSESQGFLP